MQLLTDYRTGTLGRISLETPESRRTMLADTAAKAVAADDVTTDAAPAI
jgi:ribosome biogenesis GTPase A